MILIDKIPKNENKNFGSSSIILKVMNENNGNISGSTMVGHPVILVNSAGKNLQRGFRATHGKFMDRGIKLWMASSLPLLSFPELACLFLPSPWVPSSLSTLPRSSVCPWCIRLKQRWNALQRRPFPCSCCF